jgi:hypothetical protein
VVLNFAAISLNHLLRFVQLHPRTQNLLKCSHISCELELDASISPLVVVVHNGNIFMAIRVGSQCKFNAATLDELVCGSWHNCDIFSESLS